VRFVNRLFSSTLKQRSSLLVANVEVVGLAPDVNLYESFSAEYERSAPGARQAAWE
jgi:hypothetical protein